MLAEQMAIKVRLRLGDMQKVAHSDFELLNAMNDAWMMLWMALAARFSTIPKKTATLTSVDGRAALPEDFYLLAEDVAGVSVDGVEIVGGGDGEIRLEYYALPPEIKHDSDEIEIPRTVLLDYVEATAAIVLGKADIAASIARDAAGRLCQKREYVRIPDRKPFP